ncbi:pyranose oxidase [Naasia aerilata]|uniref:Pyranose oxidase n=1 Tax=Naasia aerilata TaxID=1162966 RepID=A0ABN6XRW2_9MICO|nr:GMC family oxidoreductase N-terminal domain-containing protein [Naasia aerilata]BDZ47729.1 pyranose oxidase [Naasia aerilata]
MSDATTYDLVIVGSGPAGSTIAREISEARPGARILLVERGPQTTPRAGESVRNLDPELRAKAERLSQGPNADGRTTVSDSRQGRPVARPGTFLLTEVVGDDPQTDMPGALASAGVGGMGQHWTCACPSPGNTERVPFIPSDELDDLLERARELLHVTQDAYPRTGVRAAVERELGAVFDGGRPADRRVQAMPLAATPTPSGRPRWSGADTVLGPLADELTRPESFELRPSTLARRVLVDESGTVRGVELEDRLTGARSEVRTERVAVAADAFGSPQLLWASGLRLPALGHYLNDQPQVMCSVYLDPRIAPPDEIAESAGSEREAMTGVSWIPFNAPDYPFHGQIMQRDAAPMVVGDVESDDRRPIVGLGCFTTKDIRFEDRVEFSEDEVDFFGMPAPRIHYGLSDTDRATIDRAIGIVTGLVQRMGVSVPGGHPGWCRQAARSTTRAPSEWARRTTARASATRGGGCGPFPASTSPGTASSRPPPRRIPR